MKHRSNETTPGWVVLSERSIVQDRWLDLRAQRCQSPDGAVLDPYYVQRHPDWVHVVALTPDDGLVLVRQWRQGFSAWLTELPGGAIDAGEAPAVAGARELLEETGYAADEVRWIGARAPEPSKFSNSIHTVLALGARLVAAQHLEAGETLSVQVRPLAEVMAELADGGGIGSATHVAGLYSALAAMGRLSLR